MEYDEDEVLTEYIWFNFYHLMTGAEQWGEKARASTDPEMNRTGAVVFGPGVWADMVRSYWLNPDNYRRRVRDRLLRDHGDTIDIRRCPSCDRIVKSPKAKQCLWCGNDWHQEAPNTPQSRSESPPDDGGRGMTVE